MFISAFMFLLNANSQSNLGSLSETLNSKNLLKGTILDGKTNTSLPYTNIFLLNKNLGVVSNEMGHFSINIEDCKQTDTVRISYIGYETLDLTINDIKSSSIIYLMEDPFMLNNITVFGNVPDVKNIVKKVLENQEKNYGKTHYKKQIFLRERYMNELEKINFGYFFFNDFNLYFR